MIASVTNDVNVSSAPTLPGCLFALPPYTTNMAKSNASTMPMTANANNTTSRTDARRAAAWCSKKFMAPCSPAQGGRRNASELHLRRGAHLSLVDGRDLQQRGRSELEHAGDDARREHLAPVVVAHHGIVERLAGERDLVFGRGQFLGQLHHVLVGLEVRIGLRHRHQSPERTVQHALGTGEFGHRRRIAGARLGRGQSGHRGAAGSDHGFQRLAFMFDVTLRGFDQVGDQVEATLQLYVDLREGVAERVSRGHKAVVNAHRPERQRNENCQQYQKRDHGCSPCSCKVKNKRYDRPARAAYAGGYADERRYESAEPAGPAARNGATGHARGAAAAGAGIDRADLPALADATVIKGRHRNDHAGPG